MAKVVGWDMRLRGRGALEAEKAQKRSRRLDWEWTELGLT